MSTQIITSSVMLRCPSDRLISFDSHRRALLHEQGFTNGMIRQLELASSDKLLHIWILDNSTSTNQADCNRYIATSGVHGMRPDKCTRWEELKDTAMYHAQMASWIQAPTIFRLLNAVPGIESEFTIASQPYLSNENSKQELLLFQQWLHSVRLTERTALTNHFQELCKSIQTMEEALRAKGKNVVLTIATDGLPSDENGICNDQQCLLFRKSLRALEKLPLQIIFRLSTNHSDVKKFYSSLKRDVRFRVVVMTAFDSEAQNIHPVNDWLTYSLSVHRMRECCAAPSLLDSVAARPLSLYEMRDYCIFLFGYGSIRGVMDPTSEWPNFFLSSKRLLKGQNEQWDPFSNKFQPMLNLKRLSKVYGPSRRPSIIGRLFRFGL